MVAVRATTAHVPNFRATGTVSTALADMLDRLTFVLRAGVWLGGGVAQALGEDTRKYVDIMQRVVDREETVVELELDDVLAVSDAFRVGV